MKAPCELCSKGTSYGYRVDGTFWRLCLGCVAEFRAEGKRVRPEIAHRQKVAA